MTTEPKKEETKKEEKFTHSITFKVIIIGVLTLLMLIPNVMIQDLILERKSRSEETIRQINSQWSDAQTLCGPLLCIPYETKKGSQREKHLFYITPEHLNIKVNLYPEMRHFGIYKTILYKSEVTITGNFNKMNTENLPTETLQWNKAFLAMGLSDLRGVTSKVDFMMGHTKYEAETGNKSLILEKALIIHLNEESLPQEKNIDFSCKVNLNGSSYMKFIPVGKTTQVEINGNWAAPGFTGTFSPEHNITKENFHAFWSVLYFNRDIPEY